MRQLTRNLVSLGWAALLLVGLPVGLIRLAGWPLPTHLPSRDELAGWVARPVTRETVIAAAACVAWLMWAALLAAALAEAYTYAARLCRHLPRIHLPGPLQGLSAAMLGTVAVSTAGAGATPAAAHASVAATGADTAHRTLPILTNHHTPTQPATVAPAAIGPGVDGRGTMPADGHHDTVTVRPGDTLSAIAADRLGDANQWPEIFALNHGTHFSDVGGTLTNPDLIYPGWTLRLPDNASPRPAATPPAPPPPPNRPGPGQPTPPSLGPVQPTAPPSSAAPSTDPSSPATVRPSPTTGGDGAVEQGPPAASTPSPGSTPAPSRSASNVPAARRSAGTPAGVSLPGGSWLDMGLAAAVLAAVALVWAHRSRRYTRRPPSPDLRLDDPAVRPMPAVVTQIRRALRRPVPEPLDSQVDIACGYVDGIDVAGIDEHDAEFTDDEPEEGADRDAEVAVDSAPPPVTPALNNPMMQVWPPAGLGLTGPGAEAAARGFLAAALAAGGLDDPDGRSRVVIPTATLATLLGAAAGTPPDTPRLTVTAGLDDALEILETQILHRTRLVYRHEVDNVAALRQADPFEGPLPPIVFIADATAHHERVRIAALLTQGQRLDIHGVLLGAWPDGNTVVVAADGTTRPADREAVRHGAHPADVARMTVLTPAGTADLVATLAESHTGQPQSPAPTEPAAIPSPATQPAAKPVPAPTAVVDDAVDPPGVTHASAACGDPAEQAAPPSTPSPAPDASAAAVGEDTLAQPDSADTIEAAAVDGTDTDTDVDVADGALPARPGRVEVAVLGAPTIVDADPTRSLRAKSLELLVYLAVHDGAASQEAILDDLLPDAPAAKAPQRLHTYISALRTTLRHTGGPSSYLTHPPHRYALNPDTVDVDLWRMRHALREAAQATDDQTRLAALRRAVDTYAGPLAHDVDYEWIEPYRQAVRQQALDACLALAEALHGQPAETLAVLDAAIRHNPYAEPLYQAAMRAHADLGHLDAIRDLRRALTRRMQDIDAEPSDDTIALADQLIAQLQRPARRPAPRPGDGADA